MELEKRVIKHIPVEQLEQLIRGESNKHLYQRLLFIRQLYTEDGIEKACKIMCLSKQTGYDWLEKWNLGGYDGLRPEFGGGRPPRLNEKQKEELKEKLKTKNNWLTSEIRALIRKDFYINYSIRQIQRLLRSFKMHYAKPYPEDYRRPENALELLRQSIENAVKNASKDTILGFLDEASPQTTDNKQRFWSFDKPRIVKNTTKYRANTFGFYSMNGQSVVDFKDRSTSPYLCEFLRHIRDKNPIRHIILVVDNAKSHIAKRTQSFAKSLNITLLFLPPYSPHLNPIELIWKSVRRRISQIFSESEWAFRETIKTTFCRLAKKMTFMDYWIKLFQTELSNLL